MTVPTLFAVTVPFEVRVGRVLFISRTKSHQHVAFKLECSFVQRLWSSGAHFFRLAPSFNSTLIQPKAKYVLVQYPIRAASDQTYVFVMGGCLRIQRRVTVRFLWLSNRIIQHRSLNDPRAGMQSPACFSSSAAAASFMFNTSTFATQNLEKKKRLLAHKYRMRNPFIF